MFNEEPVVKDEKIKALFVHLLAQALLKLLKEQSQDSSEILAEEPVSFSSETHFLKPTIIAQTAIERISAKILQETPKIDLIFSLEEDVLKYIENFPNNSQEGSLQDLRKIAIKLYELLSMPKTGSSKLIFSMFLLCRGELDQLEDDLLSLLAMDKRSLKLVKQLLQDFQHIVRAHQETLSQKMEIVQAAASEDTAAQFKDFKESLRNKVLDTKDLFKAFDADKSGKISLEEFKLLTKRLKMDLSEHRIVEIFTSVKKGEGSLENGELNEKEFELAFSYLQEKSIMLTLEYLGITKEILFGILLWLVFLLLVLFAFIFAGIAAFTISGTFGSIINSIFPIGFFSFLFIFS